MEGQTLYAGFILIMTTGLFMGFLHSIMPCEDKAIFVFYVFGVARDWKQAFRILVFYSAGFMFMNVTLGTLVSFFSGLFSKYLIQTEGRFIMNGIAAFSLIFSGGLMLFRLRKHKYLPHSDQLQELSQNIGLLRKRKRTAFLLGILAAIPPCIVETAVYILGIGYSATYGWGNGVWVFFFFSLGTFIGLIPFTFMGTIHGRLDKSLKSNSFLKIKEKVQNINIITSKTNNIEEDKENLGPQENEDLSKTKRNISKIELFSAYFLIFMGMVFLILAILKYDLLIVNINDYV